MFYLALYDLDNFRSQIQSNRLLDDFEIDSTTVDKAMEDDVQLLNLGMKWVRQVLFEK